MKNYNKTTMIALIGDYKNKEPIGTAVYSQKFIKAIENLDLNLDLCILSLADIEKPWFLNKSALPSEKNNSASFLLYRKLFFGIKTVKQIAMKKPEMILCLEENLSPLCFLLNYFFRIRYAIFAHDPQSWNGGRSRKSLSNAKWIIANSMKTRQRIIEQLNIAQEKFFVIHPYVDEECFYPQERNGELVEKYGLKNDRVILTVGRVDKDGLERKRQNLVIKAVSMVKKRISNIKYLIVGPGDQKDSLKNLAKDYGVKENVIFVGSIPEKDLYEYYNLCDIFVMPSRNEGFGMAYLEALACGKPVVGSIGTGAEDALLDGKLGILVNPNDINSLAEAIINVFEGNIEPHLINPEYLRKTVIEHFGFDKFCGSIKNFLQETQIL